MELLSAVQPFLAGAIAGVTATTAIQPIDLVKTRLQLSGEGTLGKPPSPFAVARQILATSGPGGFYVGYSAAVTRQLVYGSARLGLFRIFSDRLRAQRGGEKPLPMTLKIAAGLASGAIGSVIGNPADLALVRMQADSTLPLEQRRGYRGVLDAVARITREEGVLALWRGSTPTVARAMALNASMMATADQTKELLAPYLGGQRSMTNLSVSSAIAGFVAAGISLPFDLIKTRMQKQRANLDGSLPYKSFLDCARKVVASEGLSAFYKGFGTFVVRIAPHAFISLVVLDLANAQLGAWVKAAARRREEESK